MSNRVYTYTKITELKKAPYFAEIAAIPQLTMSREVAAGMSYDMRIFKGNILDFSDFAQRLFPGWNTGSQKFLYVTALNQFLRKKITAAKDKAEKDWLYGCKKNLYFAINNMMRLEEAKVRPEDIKERDRDILLFIEMWKHLEQLDNSMKDFRDRMTELWNPEAFDESVKRIFKFHGNKRIVWNGFQFLTPIQQFVYDCFRHAGYDVYALIQDEGRYPYANEIWNHLYNGKNGFPARMDWIRQKDPEKTNPLGEIFENGKKTDAPNVKIIEYNNTIDFIEDIPRIKDEGFYLYCADDRAANSLLKDYYPERYEVRNLLAYPVGQFVYTLHRMWDESLQCIVLSQDGLRKCFASGWLSVNGKSSANYTEDMERLLPYFEGCYTVEEWRERLQNFLDAYENAIDVFSHEASPDQIRDSRQETLGNPFRYFGEFSVQEDRIDVVITMIGRLINMAQMLFGSNEPVSIREYMSKLDTMLYMDEEVPTELYLEERKKVKQIFDVLESENVRDFLCYPGDIAAALLALMGGKDEEEEGNSGLKTLVFNIFQVEAAPVSAKGKVHVCLADIGKLPGTSGKLHWPLDEDLLKNVAAETHGTYLSNWVENNQLTVLSNRYYIYSALKNEQVELSWIRNQGQKVLSPSPYITLLNRLTDITIGETDIRRLDMQHVSEIDTQNKINRKFDIRGDQELHIYDDELEYALCPMRFVYSCVLGGGPAYRNEYQRNRAIVRLIQVLKRLLGNQYSIDQVAEQVFELFPGIRKAEKRQMLDDALKWNLPEKQGTYTTYGDRNYSNYRLNLAFPDDGSYQRAQKIASMLMSQEGRKGICYDTGKKDGVKSCVFCPHAGYCQGALFGVDYKGE